MATFKKIYKKNANNTYDNIANIGDINNNEINVFDKINGNYPNGLIPTPHKSSYAEILNGSGGWKKLSLQSKKTSVQDDVGITFFAGLKDDGTDNKYRFVIDKNHLLSKDQYNKIEQLKGGFAVLDGNHSATLDGIRYTSYQKCCGNILSAYVSASNKVSNIATSNHSVINTLDTTKDKRILLTDDYISKCTSGEGNRAELMGPNIRAKRTSGGISLFNSMYNNVMIAATFRVSIKSGKKGYCAEVVPFIDGTRQAYQASYIYSGGNFFNSKLLTYIFDIPLKNQNSTVIELYAKSTNGTNTLQITDANFTVLSVNNNPYFLVNDFAPLSSRKTL